MYRLLIAGSLSWLPALSFRRIVHFSCPSCTELLQVPLGLFHGSLSFYKNPSMDLQYLHPASPSPPHAFLLPGNSHHHPRFSSCTVSSTPRWCHDQARTTWLSSVHRWPVVHFSILTIVTRSTARKGHGLWCHLMPNRGSNSVRFA